MDRRAGGGGARGPARPRGRQPAARPGARGAPRRRSAPGASRRCSCWASRRASSPAAARPEPFLPDDVRREVATASGLMLPLREDQLDRERYLFYVCASRAERLLVLSSRTSDEEGTPEAPSFFLDDVRELLADPPVRVRSLGEVTWTPDEAPTAAEWDRALAARGPRRQERLPGHAHRRPAARVAGGAAGAVGQLARALRRLPGQVARGERPAARGARARPGADGPRPARPRGARAHLQARPRGDRGAARDAREPPAGRADPARGAGRSALASSASRPSRRACAPPRAGSSSTWSGTSAARPSATARSCRTASSCASARARRWSTVPWRSATGCW